MSSSTCIPLLFSSAAIKSLTFSLPPGSQHEHTLKSALPHTRGEQQPSEQTTWTTPPMKSFRCKMETADSTEKTSLPCKH